MKRILTYGTFDLLHYGHIRLLKRAKAMGDYLIDYGIEKAQQMLTRWQQLFQFMVVKYNDMIIKPTKKDGSFEKTPYGLDATPVRPHPSEVKILHINLAILGLWATTFSSTWTSIDIKKTSIVTKAAYQRHHQGGRYNRHLAECS